MASILMRPPAPRASRTASTRAQSADSRERGSATFTLAVAHPEEETMRYACPGSTTGTVILTGMLSRSGSGSDDVAPSMPARSQAEDSAAS